MSALDAFIAATASYLQSPECFLLKQENVYNETKEKVKAFYDHALQQVLADVLARFLSRVGRGISFIHPTPSRLHSLFQFHLGWEGVPWSSAFAFTTQPTCTPPYLQQSLLKLDVVICKPRWSRIRWESFPWTLCRSC